MTLFNKKPTRNEQLYHKPGSTSDSRIATAPEPGSRIATAAERAHGEAQANSEVNNEQIGLTKAHVGTGNAGTYPKEDVPAFLLTDDMLQDAPSVHAGLNKMVAEDAPTAETMRELDESLREYLGGSPVPEPGTIEKVDEDLPDFGALGGRYAGDTLRDSLWAIKNIDHDSVRVQAMLRATELLSEQEQSDGSTARYYELPGGSEELQDLISYRDMNAQVGEIFRACYRYGRVKHSNKLRDAKKIKFYIEAEIARLETYEY